MNSDKKPNTHKSLSENPGESRKPSNLADGAVKYFGQITGGGGSSVRILGVILLMVLITTFFQLITHTFFSKLNMIDILRTASVSTILAMALAIVIAAGGLDLSIGHIAGFVGVIAALLMVNMGVSYWIAILAGFALGAFLGAFNGFMVAWMGISSFIATLGMQFLLLGLRYWITGGVTIMGLPRSFKIIGNSRFFDVPSLVIIMVIVVLLVFFFFENTVMGRRIVSIGGNLRASHLSGVNVRVYTALTFIFSGLLSAVAGLLISSWSEMARVDLGDNYLLDVLTIAVLSSVIFGRFKAFGIMLVSIMLSMIMNGLNMMGVSPSAMFFVNGSIMLFAITVGKIVQTVEDQGRKKTSDISIHQS